MAGGDFCPASSIGAEGASSGGLASAKANKLTVPNWLFENLTQLQRYFVLKDF